MEFKFPVYVLDKDSRDVYLYKSRKEMNALEGVDVEAELYEAWDCDGQILQLIAKGVKRGRSFIGLGWVIVGSFDVLPTGRYIDQAQVRELASRAE